MAQLYLATHHNQILYTYKIRLFFRLSLRILLFLVLIGDVDGSKVYVAQLPQSASVQWSQQTAP